MGRWLLSRGVCGGDVGKKAWARVRLSLAGVGVVDGDHCQLEFGSQCFSGRYRPAHVPWSQRQPSGSWAYVD